jgi:membrane protein
VIILWFIAGTLFSKYLSNFDQVNIIYGSLGGIIAFLLFFYITAMIFIYGAELNYRLQKAIGNKIEEKE